jgi:glycosyltransferase involved in cell wall biosynthesis
MVEEAESGQTSKMRDRGFAEAKGDWIVAMDDDILLDADFSEHIGEEVIQIPRCDGITGGRFWDWAILGHPEKGQRLINYDEPYTKYNYLSGQCYVIKSDIAKKYKHNYNLKFHEKDDVAYGEVLQEAGHEFSLNKNLHCIHFDPRYHNYNGIGVYMIHGLGNSSVGN